MEAICPQGIDTPKAHSKSIGECFAQNWTKMFKTPVQNAKKDGVYFVPISQFFSCAQVFYLGSPSCSSKIKCSLWGKAFQTKKKRNSMNKRDKFKENRQVILPHVYIIFPLTPTLLWQSPSMQLHSGPAKAPPGSLGFLKNMGF